MEDTSLLLFEVAESDSPQHRHSLAVRKVLKNLDPDSSM